MWCKCCQYCLESCYWHCIEKRFCYDESIALYEDPVKEEKNNNMFDNLAFYDSIAVIAGRSIVTIDELPDEKHHLSPITTPITQQPMKKLQWREDKLAGLKNGFFSKSVPLIFERSIPEDDLDVCKSDTTINFNVKKPSEESSESLNEETYNRGEGTRQTETQKSDYLKPEGLNVWSDLEIRRKSLSERRQSKSLYLKIDHNKELPIIRQNSMPKFYLDTPQANQTESCIFRSPSSALASPVKPKSGFVFDLYTVVQMEKNRVENEGSTKAPVHNKDDRSSKLLHLRDKVKLRRVKSSLASLALPHHTHHI